MTHQLQYGTTTIEFHLSYRDRKTLGIQVYQRVHVIAPEHASKEKINQKVRHRARWIKRQQRYFSDLQRKQIPREYISGETHRYLGRQYRLKVRETTEKEEVKLKGQFFWIWVKNKRDTQRVKQLLNRWYRNHAENKFQERLDICYEKMRREQLPYPDLQIRKMKKRWGSCTRNQRILLNPELIKTPLYCIDYVIIHELCHLKVPHHGNAFYKLKEKYLPNWKNYKKRLERVSLNN